MPSIESLRFFPGMGSKVVAVKATSTIISTGGLMKAILFHEHGGPDVLAYEDLPTPQPGPGEVQIRLHAAALNRLDLWVREGWPGIKLEYPHIPGADGAGEVATLGEDVKGFNLGDRVLINSVLSCGQCKYCLAGKDNMCQDFHLLGETIRGTYAEYIVIPKGNLIRLPEEFGYHEAAAAGLVYQTAWHSLVARGRLQANETVLIVGASGGVNTASIQIAKHIGAEVYVVGSNAKKLSLAESLGADVLIDRSKEENWSKAIYKATDRKGVDVVVDNVGGGSLPFSLRAACKGGRILTVGNTGGAKFEIDNRFIFGKHLSIIGSTMGSREDFSKVMGLVFEGALKPVIDRKYPLQEARAAQERLAAGEQMGKITLEI